MYCKKCGAEVEDEARFCKSCGTEVREQIDSEVTESKSDDQPKEIKVSEGDSQEVFKQTESMRENNHQSEFTGGTDSVKENPKLLEFEEKLKSQLSRLTDKEIWKAYLRSLEKRDLAYSALTALVGYAIFMFVTFILNLMMSHQLEEALGGQGWETFGLIDMAQIFLQNTYHMVSDSYFGSMEMFFEFKIVLCLLVPAIGILASWFILKRIGYVIKNHSAFIGLYAMVFMMINLMVLLISGRLSADLGDMGVDAIVGFSKTYTIVGVFCLSIILSIIADALWFKFYKQIEVSDSIKARIMSGKSILRIYIKSIAIAAVLAVGFYTVIFKTLDIEGVFSFGQKFILVIVTFLNVLIAMINSLYLAFPIFAVSGFGEGYVGSNIFLSSPWFFILYIFGFLGLILCLYRYNVRRLQSDWLQSISLKDYINEYVIKESLTLGVINGFLAFISMIRMAYVGDVISGSMALILGVHWFMGLIMTFVLMVLISVGAYYIQPVLSKKELYDKVLSKITRKTYGLLMVVLLILMMLIGAFSGGKETKAKDEDYYSYLLDGDFLDEEEDSGQEDDEITYEDIDSGTWHILGKEKIMVEIQQMLYTLDLSKASIDQMDDSITGRSNGRYDVIGDYIYKEGVDELDIYDLDGKQMNDDLTPIDVTSYISSIDGAYLLDDKQGKYYDVSGKLLFDNINDSWDWVQPIDGETMLVMEGTSLESLDLSSQKTSLISDNVTEEPIVGADDVYYATEEDVRSYIGVDSKKTIAVNGELYYVGSEASWYMTYAENKYQIEKPDVCEYIFDTEPEDINGDTIYIKDDSEDYWICMDNPVIKDVKTMMQ